MKTNVYAANAEREETGETLPDTIAVRPSPAPPPYSSTYNLVEWTYLKLTGGL